MKYSDDKTHPVSHWIDQLTLACEREKNWRKQAEAIIKIYEGHRGDGDSSSYNILFANTSILQPAVFSAMPKPAITPRYKTKDPLASAVSLTLNRTLDYLMDQGSSDTLCFDTAAKAAIINSLITGRGVVRFVYTASMSSPVPQEPAETLNPSAEGLHVQTAPIEQVADETIKPAIIMYNRFLHSYANCWEDVAWIAFEHRLTYGELVNAFGKSMAKRLETYISSSSVEQSSNNNEEFTKKILTVHEIWDKDSKMVRFVCPDYPESYLKEVEDPLKLSGFFPIAKPLYFTSRVDNLLPLPLYKMYESQAEELNRISIRIQKLIVCLKVRGMYDAAVMEMPEILAAEDNTLVPMNNVMSLGENRTLKDAIYFMPLTEIITVLQNLYIQRTQIKTIIQEITGLSDIIRGSSVASETATAQNLKNTWGTLKLKELQSAVNLWCRGSLRIMAEMAGNLFSIETLQKMTSLPYVTDDQFQQAQQALQQSQVSQQQTPPPKELTDILNTPKWSDIKSLLGDSINKSYRIDIETNSTIAADLAESKKDMAEMMNSLSQFLNGIAPLIQNGSMPFEVAKTILLGMVRKMAMGDEVAEQLEQMVAPAPPQPEPEPSKKPEISPETLQLQAQIEQQELQNKSQMMAQEFEFFKQEMALKMQLLQAEKELELLKIQTQRETILTTEKGDDDADV